MKKAANTVSKRAFIPNGAAYDDMEYMKMGRENLPNPVQENGPAQENLPNPVQEIGPALALFRQARVRKLNCSQYGSTFVCHKG